MVRTLNCLYLLLRITVDGCKLVVLKISFMLSTVVLHLNKKLRVAPLCMFAKVASDLCHIVFIAHSVLVCM